MQAHVNYKFSLVDTPLTDIDLCMQSVRNTVRTLRNETTIAAKTIEAENR
ncbi:hypothetical protein [Glaciimonas soli]|nr:hypothetical protein [Glaciimonas soli]